MDILVLKEKILNSIHDVVNADDSTSIIRKIMSENDIELPYGNNRGLIEALSSNSFTQWRSCSIEEAISFVNEGIPTIGIDEENLILFVPNEIAVSINETEKIKNIIKPVELLETNTTMTFFAYSAPSMIISYNYGSVSNVPSSMSNDGFGGWYIPAPNGANPGVSGNVPRFVQLSSGPCVAYTIMMGDYYLTGVTTAPSTWFSNNVSTYWNGQATGTAMSKVNKVSYNMNTMKSQLNLGKPVCVTGKNSYGTPHMALVVAYVGCGANTSDYVVVDPLYGANFYTTLYEFKQRFPNNASNWIGGLTNPMCTFI